MNPARGAALVMIGIVTSGAGGLDVKGDLVIDRVAVPSADRPQGEVRIVRRDGHPIVQTLLSTKVLKRVIGAIADKERRGWPEGAAGHADSQRYVAALEAFQRTELARRDAAGPNAPRRLQVLIEFVDEPGHPIVAVGGATIESVQGSLTLVSRSEPVVLDLSSDYVLRNMRLIVADSFHVTIDEANRRLAAEVTK